MAAAAAVVCVAVSVCAEFTQSLNSLGFSFLFLRPWPAPWHLVQSISKVSEASSFPRAAKGRRAGGLGGAVSTLPLQGPTGSPGAARRPEYLALGCVPGGIQGTLAPGGGHVGGGQRPLLASCVTSSCPPYHVSLQTRSPVPSSADGETRREIYSRSHHGSSNGTGLPGLWLLVQSFHYSR